MSKANILGFDAWYEEEVTPLPFPSPLAERGAERSEAGRGAE